MSENKKNINWSHGVTILLTVIGFIVTVVVAYPSFMSLNTKEAKVYYSSKSSYLIVPEIKDKSSINELLIEKGIPISTYSIEVINQGNKATGLIKVQVKSEQNILNAWVTPEIDENTIWVNKPKIILKEKEAYISIDNLSSTKHVSINIGFSGVDKGSISEVIYSGLPVIEVNSIRTVPRWSKFGVFILPLQVLGGVVGVVLLWAFGIVLISKPELRSSLANLFSAVAIEAVPGLGKAKATGRVKKEMRCLEKKPPSKFNVTY